MATFIAAPQLQPLLQPSPLTNTQTHSLTNNTPSAPNALAPEFCDDNYLSEVLLLEDGGTEDAVDAVLAQDAATLGINIPPPTLHANANGHTHTSLCDSTATVASEHARTASSGSQDSASTGMTSRSSDEHLGANENGKDSSDLEANAIGRGVLRRSLSFSEYDRFLEQPQLKPTRSHIQSPEPASSLFSVSKRKSLASLRSGIRSRFSPRRQKMSSDNIYCISCRNEFKEGSKIQRLACSHVYCEKCLRGLIQQASSEESQMPPECCSLAIPAPIIKSVLGHEEQYAFMKCVSQYSTPSEKRVFCPNLACSEFIPNLHKINVQHPFEVACTECKTKACSLCKYAAHMDGHDCPKEWNVDEAIRVGGRHAWRRCYRCRSFVAPNEETSCVTCQCDAQFCYLCGGIWDFKIGCPNNCDEEEGTDRHCIDNDLKIATMALEATILQVDRAASAVEEVEELKRTAENGEMKGLRQMQIEERDRFSAFERKMKWHMWTRHAQQKIELLDRFGDLQAKTTERHTKTTMQLEDRQVTAEMELRGTLKQAEKSVQIRLRHMEAYCNGLGRANALGPPRVVTERNLRELGQQYNIRDDMERLHQSRINVIREKQSKQMDQLLATQEAETEVLARQQDAELDDLEEAFAIEEEKFTALFDGRRERLKRRWRIACEVARRRLAIAHDVTFGAMPDVEWPDLSKGHESLEIVTEATE